jgi:hypothetical protein
LKLVESYGLQLIDIEPVAGWSLEVVESC